MKLVTLIIYAMLLLTAGNKVVFGSCEEWEKLSQLIKSQDENKIDEIKTILEKNPDCYENALYSFRNLNDLTFAEKCLNHINVLQKFLKEKYCMDDVMMYFTYGDIKKEYLELLLKTGANINCKTGRIMFQGAIEAQFKNASLLHWNLRDWWYTTFDDFVIKSFNYSRERNTLRFLLDHGADVDLPADSIKLKNTKKNIIHEYQNISAYELAKKLDLKEVVQMMEPYHKSSTNNVVDYLAQAFRLLSK